MSQEAKREYYQSIGFVFELARFASAFSRTADASQLFGGVAKRLGAASRPRAEVVVRQSGVHFATVLFRGAQVALPSNGDELPVIPATGVENISLFTIVR